MIDVWWWTAEHLLSLAVKNPGRSLTARINMFPVAEVHKLGELSCAFEHRESGYIFYGRDWQITLYYCSGDRRIELEPKRKTQPAAHPDN